MTIDTRNELERAAAHAPAPSLEFDQLRRRRDRRIRTRKAGVMVVALGIAVLLIVALVTTEGTRSRPSTDAAVGGSPDAFAAPTGLQMGPGDVFYQHIGEIVASGVPGVSSPEVAPAESEWWRLDGSGRIDQGVQDDRFEAGKYPNYSDLSGLSTDAGALLIQLRARTAADGASPEPCDQVSPGPGQEGSDTACMMWPIVTLLTDSTASPELRAALFRVMAGLQGVEVTRETVDPAGRPAVRLDVTSNGVRRSCWFDPTTQQLTAMKDVAAPGTAGSFVEIIERAGITSSLDSTDLRVVLVPPASSP